MDLKFKKLYIKKSKNDKNWKANLKFDNYKSKNLKMANIKKNKPKSQTLHI